MTHDIAMLAIDPPICRRQMRLQCDLQCLLETRLRTDLRYSACYFYLLTKQLCQSDSELEYGISCVLVLFRTYSARTGVCESFPRNVNKHKPPVMGG